MDVSGFDQFEKILLHFLKIGFANPCDNSLNRKLTGILQPFYRQIFVQDDRTYFN
ncbi:unnamed protein product, partial [Larinioides sclopetarius]